MHSQGKGGILNRMFEQLMPSLMEIFLGRIYSRLYWPVGTDQYLSLLPIWMFGASWESYLQHGVTNCPGWRGSYLLYHTHTWLWPSRAQLLHAIMYCFSFLTLSRWSQSYQTQGESSCTPISDPDSILYSLLCASFTDILHGLLWAS